MDITVSIGFEKPRSQGSVLPSTIQGGVRVEVQGNELTRAVGQSDTTDEKSNRLTEPTVWYDYQGNEHATGKWAFKGGYIEAILSSLAEVVKDLGAGTVGRHEQRTVELVKSDYVLIFSYIDSQHDVLRMAFQNGRVGESDNPTVEGAVGYPVPFDGLCREIARCLREYVEYARRSDFDPDDWESLDEFETDAERLEELADR